MKVCPEIRVFLILVGFAVQGYCQFDQNDQWYTPQNHVFLNVAEATHEDYLMALFQINYFIVTGCLNHVDGHAVLPVQLTGMRPLRWVFLHLTGIGQETIILAIRGDNLYVTGITNTNNIWHVFGNRAVYNLIRPAVPFRFRDDYSSLVGGYRNLADLRLSKDSVLQAISFLARYQRPESNTIDEGHIKRSIAILLVVFVEALRFSDIADTVATGWDFGTNLSPKQARYIVLWKPMSCALLMAKQNNGQWGTGRPNSETLELNEAGIYTMEDAQAVIGVILRPNPGACTGPFNWLV